MIEAAAKNICIGDIVVIFMNLNPTTYCKRNKSKYHTTLKK
jgi:hypothetical protein